MSSRSRTLTPGPCRSYRPAPCPEFPAESCEHLVGCAKSLGASDRTLAGVEASADEKTCAIRVVQARQQLQEQPGGPTASTSWNGKLFQCSSSYVTCPCCFLPLYYIVVKRVLPMKIVGVTLNDPVLATIWASVVGLLFPFLQMFFFDCMFTILLEHYGIYWQYDGKGVIEFVNSAGESANPMLASPHIFIPHIVVIFSQKIAPFVAPAYVLFTVLLHVKQKFGIKEPVVTTYLKSQFCGCCFLVQVADHLSSVGEPVRVVAAPSGSTEIT